MPDSLRQSFAAPPASFADYGAIIGARLTKGLEGRGELPALFLEPGTALVADTQQFYTQVVSTKSIRGRHFATVAGSSFDISPTARSRNLPVTPVLQKPRSDDGKSFDIVGYTCIEKDILSENVRAPLVVDDFVCYDNVGSYSVVMRPPFILPANPILMKDGKDLRLIKERQTTDEVFQNFRFE
jgi:diaminopimelate decarboxylase